MSKFIKNSRLNKSPKLWNNYLPDGYWQSKPISAEDKEKQTKY